VILDSLEKLYLAGFSLLLAFVTVSPALTQRQHINADACVPSSDFSCSAPEIDTAGVQTAAMEFLPLMLTSVYCAIGLVWGFLRLMFIYLNEETTYQGQLSSLR